MFKYFLPLKEAAVKISLKNFSFKLVVIGFMLLGRNLLAQLTPVKTIPEFKFYKLDNSPFTQKQLKKEGKLLFLFFDATCAHCQYEMQQIGEHYKDFQNTSFYIVSMDGKQQIQKFADTYGKQLKGKENVTFLADVNREFLPKFTPSQFPALYIFNSNQQLLKYWDTPVNINQVLSVIYSK